MPNVIQGDYKGSIYRFYHESALELRHCASHSIALTVTSPPYWNAIDYDIHANGAQGSWYRARAYEAFGSTFTDYLSNIEKVFGRVFRVTTAGGFCALVVGTILHKGRHYPLPMLITERLIKMGWEFHQDIIWNKVTGGIRRAGSFIQQPRAGYYYPNIMTEYILIFRKPGAIRRDAKQALAVDELFKHDIANNIWHIAPVPPNTIDHPCPYPEELVRRLVLLYSQAGDEVLDPFLGSGQTARVALQNGRSCVGYDIVARYLKLSEQRLLNPQRQRKHNLLPRVDKIEVMPQD